METFHMELLRERMSVEERDCFIEHKETAEHQKSVDEWNGKSFGQTDIQNDESMDNAWRYTPNPKGIIFQLHGGGYYLDMNNSYRDVAVQYRDVSGGMDVLTIDYRVAPAFPYPAALEDALEAYQWILEQGYEGSDIVVAGDSAGGGLGLALCLYLRDNDMPLPKSVITMSAWTDLTCTGESYEKNFNIDPVFGGTRDSVVFQNEYYRNDSPENPYISPVFGKYDGFPPMLMQVGECEMLLSDTVTVAEKAKAAGVKVNMHIYPGMFHIFQKGMSMYPESKMAWDEVGRFLRGEKL
ncbi:MAG: alpha/beta hydrolase [Lachnospiraceae bacterium]|nr:alpha/beta hydrolase [Lachnospiraceae bacterium]